MPLACYEHAPWASLMDEFIRYTAVLPANQVGTRCACDRVGGHLHLHVSVAGTRAVRRQERKTAALLCRDR